MTKRTGTRRGCERASGVVGTRAVKGAVLRLGFLVDPNRRSPLSELSLDPIIYRSETAQTGGRVQRINVYKRKACFELGAWLFVCLCVGMSFIAQAQTLPNLPSGLSSTTYSASGTLTNCASVVPSPTSCNGVMLNSNANATLMSGSQIVLGPGFTADASNSVTTLMMLIGAPPPLVITSASLPNHPVNVSYSQQLTATGGTGIYSWSLASGSLPAGLYLSSNGLISGAPSAAGPFSFTVRVTDTWPNTATALVTLNIWDFYLTAQPSSQTVNSGSSAQVAVTINPVGGFSEDVILSAAPASGVTFSLNPATQSSTMTVPAGYGTQTYTIYGTVPEWSGLSAHQVSATFTFGTSTPSVSCSASPNIVPPGQQTTFTAYPSGGSPPYTLTWSGVVMGSGEQKTFQSPSSGAYTANISVLDAHGVTGANNSCTVTVQSQSSGSLTIISNSPLPAATLGSSYSTFLAATGGTPPYTWSVTSGSLPSGLTLSATGRISGTPTSSGTSFFALQVADVNGLHVSGSVSLAVSRLPSNLSVSCSTSGPVSPGAMVTFSANVTGGVAPYTYFWAGAVSGIGPTASASFGQVGTYAGALTVTDASGASGPASCSAAVVQIVSVPYNCQAYYAYNPGTLFLYPDGTIFAYWDFYIDSVGVGGGASVSDWSGAVNSAILTVPGGLTVPPGSQFGPTSSGWVTSPTPAAVQQPPSTTSVSALGFGEYQVSADFQAMNANCGSSPLLPLGTPTDLGTLAGSIDEPPPTLSGLSPSSGAVGVVVTGITASGVELSGTSAVVITDQSGDPATSIIPSFYVQDDNTVNLTLDLSGAAGSAVTPGVYNVALTSYGVNTGPQDFEVVDAAPYITGIQGPYMIGSTPYISIYGTNFGTDCPLASGIPCPGAAVAMCQTASPNPCGPSNNGADVLPTATYWSQNQVNAALQIEPAAAGLYDVQITSPGASGNGFLSTTDVPSGGTSQRKTMAITPTTYNLSVTWNNSDGNGSTLSANACAYISAGPPPQMPTIVAKIVDQNNQPVAGSATWQMKTVFYYKTRGVPIPPAKVGPVIDAPTGPATQNNPPGGPASGSTTYTWTPGSFQSILGGSSEIDWTYTPPGGGPLPAQVFDFMICGSNPDYYDATSALSAASPTYNRVYWFAPNIADHETSMSQFCDGSSRTAGAPLCNNSTIPIGQPIRARGAGYGIGQLDPVPPVPGCTVNCNPPSLWNWQANVQNMLGIIDGFAGAQLDSGGNSSTIIQAYPLWFRYVRWWQAYNASPAGKTNPVTAPSETDGYPTVSPASYCTLTAPTAGGAATSYTGLPNTYWYGDGILMKQYGRGYGSSVKPNSSYTYLRTYIYFDPVANQFAYYQINQGDVHNVPYEFCTCSDPSQTLPDPNCRHSTP
jgi:hypothetical protein